MGYILRGENRKDALTQRSPSSIKVFRWKDSVTKNRFVDGVNELLKTTSPGLGIEGFWSAESPLNVRAPCLKNPCWLESLDWIFTLGSICALHELEWRRATDWTKSSQWNEWVDWNARDKWNGFNLVLDFQHLFLHNMMVRKVWNWDAAIRWLSVLDSKMHVTNLQFRKFSRFH